MVTKIYSKDGVFTHYEYEKNDKTFQAGPDHIFPEGTEISEGTPPSQAEIDLYTAEKALSQTDSIIPRWAEDIYDSLSTTSKGNLAQATKDKILDKKAKRQAYLDLL